MCGLPVTFLGGQPVRVQRALPPGDVVARLVESATLLDLYLGAATGLSGDVVQHPAAQQLVGLDLSGLQLSADVGKALGRARHLTALKKLGLSGTGVGQAYLLRSLEQNGVSRVSLLADPHGGSAHRRELPSDGLSVKVEAADLRSH